MYALHIVCIATSMHSYSAIYSIATYIHIAYSYKKGKNPIQPYKIYAKHSFSNLYNINIRCHIDVYDRKDLPIFFLDSGPAFAFAASEAANWA